jgi:predicted phage replisome organizer
MADVKWIKITTDIFDDEKILLIESLPDSYAIITVWFKLLCLAGKQNNSGVFMLGRVPYTDNMLATIFRMKESTVTMALQTFKQFGMIEIIDGVITIPNWNKHQTLDAYEKKKARDRLYQAERRANQRALIDKSSDKSSDVAISDKDIEKDKEIDKENKENISDEPIHAPAPKKPTKHKRGEYSHVLLTDDQEAKLIDEYGEILTLQAITYLDEYIEMKGYKAKNHYLCIKKWVIDAVRERLPKEQGASQSSFDTDDFFNKAVEKSLGAFKTAGNDEEIRKRAEALKSKLT